MLRLHPPAKAGGAASFGVTFYSQSNFCMLPYQPLQFSMFHKWPFAGDYLISLVQHVLEQPASILAAEQSAHTANDTEWYG
jgi:hypothetical protein